MKLAIRILLTYLTLTLLFTGVLAAVFCIPRSAIEQGVRQSVKQVTDDGLMFTARVGILQPLQLGNFSDCLILGIAYCADSSQPLTAAMTDKFMMLGDSPVKGAQLMLSNPDNLDLRTVVYCRYWHGNQVVIRPLLCVTTVHGIRVINIVALTLLWLVLLAVMWRRIDHVDSLIIMGCLAAVMSPSVPFCMNYVPTFYIALAASLLVLLWRPATAKWSNTVVLMFVIGAVTVFFDLLTTPLITLAVPVTVYILYRHPQRACREVIVLALAWVAGYASLWATKWLLAALITGQDAFQDAMGAITQRTVGHGEQELAYTRWCLRTTLLSLGIVTGFTAIVTLLLRKSWQAVRQHSWALLVAMMAYVWVFVLMEHTWHHLQFTWRTFVVLAIGIGLFLRHTIKLTTSDFKL